MSGEKWFLTLDELKIWSLKGIYNSRYSFLRWNFYSENISTKFHERSCAWFIDRQVYLNNLLSKKEKKWRKVDERIGDRHGVIQRNLIISIKHIAQKLLYLPYQRATVSFLDQQFTVSINSIITNHRSWRTNRRGKNTTPPSLHFVVWTWWPKFGLASTPPPQLEILPSRSSDFRSLEIYRSKDLSIIDFKLRKRNC